MNAQEVGMAVSKMQNFIGFFLMAFLAWFVLVALCVPFYLRSICMSANKLRDDLAEMKTDMRIMRVHVDAISKSTKTTAESLALAEISRG